MSEADFEALHNQSRTAWDTNAAFWDQRMGEGNEFHKTLVEPATLALLELEIGQHVLDAACGNGQFARRMAEMGARVTAFDFSAPMIDIAKARTGAASPLTTASSTPLTPIPCLDWVKGNLTQPFARWPSWICRTLPRSSLPCLRS